MDAKLIKLSGFEKLVYYLSLAGDTLVLATSIIDAPDDLPRLDEKLFEQAVELLRRRHPFLSARLVKDLSSEAYLSLGHVDGKCEFCFGASFESRKKLIEELEAFNEKKFDYADQSKPIWRVRLDKFADEEAYGASRLALTLVIPLFLTDGINIVVLLAELVNIVNALLLSKECDEMRHRHEVMDDYFDLCQKNQLFDEAKMKLVKSLVAHKPILPNKFLLDSQLKTDAEASGGAIRFFSLDLPTSQQLVQASKAHKAKMTGVLYAICLYALKDLYAEKSVQFPQALKLSLPANLRIRVSPALSFSNMRHLINLLNFNLDAPAFGSFSDIWADSAEINRQIEACVNMEDGSFFASSHDPSAFEGFFSLVEDASLPLDEILAKCAEANDTHFMLSNTGTYAFEHAKHSSATNEGPLVMKEVYFGDSLSSKPTIGSALIVHSSTWNNQLMFQISANKSSIDSAHVDRFVELFKARASSCTCNF